MLIKELDEHAAELATLERLLLSDPPEATGRSLKNERDTILSGLKHRRDSAYHLDFYFSESRDWAVLHDLRLEMGELSTQIDHLLIGRHLDIYVIESKYFNSEVRLNEQGEFSYLLNRKPISVPSPLQRNRDNIAFLNHFLQENGLLPSRLGLTIKPQFHSIVLLSPTSRLTLPKAPPFDCSGVIHADRFLQRFSRNLEEPGVGDFVGMARMVSASALESLAGRLSQRHIPRSIDYAGRYGMKPPQRNEVFEECRNGCNCAQCNRRVTERVARYCMENRELFSGRVYCFDCQKGLAFQNGG